MATIGRRNIPEIPVVILLVFIMVSCIERSSVIKQPDEGGVVAVSISNQTGLYAKPVWFEDYIVVVYETGKQVNAFSDRLWQLETNGHDMRPLDLPDYPGCAFNAFTRPTRLPDGRLGYASICGDRQTLQRQYYLMAYDFQSGQVTSLRDQSLPYFGLGPGGYAWAPSLERGIAAQGWMVSGSLYWYTREDWGPLVDSPPQTSFGRWSPDGDMIAFIGAREQDVEARIRSDSLHDLFFMPANGGQVTAFVTGFMHPQGLDWSPDGRWLVLSADFGRGQALWLIDAVTGEQRRIIDGCFSEPSWSMDSRKIAATSCPVVESVATSELYIVDLDSLIGDSG